MSDLFNHLLIYRNLVLKLSQLLSAIVVFLEKWNEEFWEFLALSNSYNQYNYSSVKWRIPTKLYCNFTDRLQCNAWKRDIYKLMMLKLIFLITHLLYSSVPVDDLPVKSLHNDFVLLIKEWTQFYFFKSDNNFKLIMRISTLLIFLLHFCNYLYDYFHA